MPSRKVSYKAMDYCSNRVSQQHDFVGSTSGYTIKDKETSQSSNLKDSNLYGLESSETVSSSSSDMLSQVSEDE